MLHIAALFAIILHYITDIYYMTMSGYHSAVAATVKEYIKINYYVYYVK